MGAGELPGAPLGQGPSTQPTGEPVHWSDMEKPERYRRLAEAADRMAEKCRDATAKQMMQKAAERWRQLAELAERQEKGSSP